MELQNLMGILSSKKPIDYNKTFDRGMRARQGALTEEEKDKMKSEEQVT